MSTDQFEVRDRLLYQHGYRTYEDYLASELWRAIRTYVHRRDGHQCRMCKSTGRLTAHHLAYDEATLFTHPREDGSAEGLKKIVSLCDTCHDVVHRDEYGEFTHHGTDLLRWL